MGILSDQGLTAQTEFTSSVQLVLLFEQDGGRQAAGEEALGCNEGGMAYGRAHN